MNEATLDGAPRPAARADARPSLEVPLLTAPEAAALLAVRPSWVYEAVREGGGGPGRAGPGRAGLAGLRSAAG
jgi:hypothetical protein